MVRIRTNEDFQEVAEKEEKLSVPDMKKKEKFSHLAFQGNPKKLMSFIKNELDNNGYQVKYDALDTKGGGFGNDISDVSLRVYAEKRKDIKGKIKVIIPRKLLILTFIGFLLLVLAIIFFNTEGEWVGAILLAVSAVFIAGGAFLMIKGPKQKMFSYYPSSNILWLVGEGEAFFGSKTQESKSGHERKSGSSNAVKTSYLTGDIDVYIAASTKSLDTLYRQRLLKDRERINPSFIQLIKGAKESVKEISMENEGEFNRLPNDKEDHKKHISQEMEAISKKLGKFIGVD